MTTDHQVTREDVLRLCIGVEAYALSKFTVRKYNGYGDSVERYRCRYCNAEAGTDKGPDAVPHTENCTVTLGKRVAQWARNSSLPRRCG